MSGDRMTLTDALMGGPGLDGYAYQADVYCVSCGREIIRSILLAVYESWPHCAMDSLDFQNSETIPQPIFFGESPDYPQHCGDCGEYLYGDEAEDEC